MVDVVKSGEFGETLPMRKNQIPIISDVVGAAIDRFLQGKAGSGDFATVREYREQMINSMTPNEKLGVALLIGGRQYRAKPSRAKVRRKV